MGAKLRPTKLIARVSSTAPIHMLLEVLWDQLVPKPCHGEGMRLEKPSGSRAGPDPASSESK